MREILLVGFGSFIGGISRYAVSLMFLNYLPQLRLPLATIAVNICGCLLIGFISAVSEQNNLISQQLKIFLITGILGGFTTFSAFSYETVILIKDNRLDLAFLNIFISVAAGILAVYCGIRLAR